MAQLETGGFPPGAPPGDVLDTPEAGPLVIRGGALRMASYGLGTALSVVSAAVLIRYLGAGDFGRYVTIVSLVTVVGAVTEAGMTNLAVREYATLSAGPRAHAMRVLLGLRLALTLGGALLAIAFTVASGYSEALVVGAALAGVGLIFGVLQATYSVPLATYLLIGRVSALELAKQVLTVVAIVALVVAGAGLVPLLATPVPVGLVVAAATAWMVRGSMPLLPAVDVREWARLLKVTASFALAAAVGTVYIYLAVVLLSLVSTDAETGQFGAAFRVFVVLAAVPGLLVTTAFPLLARAARDDGERLRYALQRLFDMALVLGTGFTVATVIGAPIAIDVVAGAGFAPAVDVLRIQGFAMLASFMLATWGFALISLHLHRSLLAANLAALVTSATLVLTLGSSHGAAGAAWGTLAGETVLAAGYLLALVRARRELRPALRTAPRVLAAVLPAVALGLSGLPALPATLLALAAYGALALWLRAVPEELLERIPLRVRNRPPL
jgi:O-antigen/teichoic acid export membrane protein